MNYLTIAYSLLVFCAMGTITNAITFENVAELAKIYCTHNAEIEATTPSTDPAYSKFSDNAKKMLTSDKLSDAQKVILVEFLKIDDDDFDELAKEYLNKNTELKKETTAQTPDLKIITEYAKTAAQIVTLAEYFGLSDFSPSSDTFELTTNRLITEYDAQLKEIERLLLEHRNKKPSIKPAPKPDETSTNSSSTNGSTTTPIATPWLDELAQFFTEEIKRRSTTSQKYNELAQSIQGLETNPGNGATVIQTIAAYIGDNIDDQQYVQTVTAIFQKLATQIKAPDFKQIFGNDYQGLALIASYLNEDSLRTLYTKGITTALGHKQQTLIRNITNNAFLEIAMKKILNDLDQATTVNDVKNIFTKNKRLFAFAKKAPELASKMNTIVNQKSIAKKSGWSWLETEWKKLSAQDVSKEKELINF